MLRILITSGTKTIFCHCAYYFFLEILLRHHCYIEMLLMLQRDEMRVDDIFFELMPAFTRMRNTRRSPSAAARYARCVIPRQRAAMRHVLCYVYEARYPSLRHGADDKVPAQRARGASASCLRWRERCLPRRRYATPRVPREAHMFD